MGFFSWFFGGDDNDGSHDVKSSSSTDYGNARVTTFGNKDGSSTTVSHYHDKDGYPHVVVADKDASGHETGHTTAHGNPSDGIGSHQHGSHK